ncbi:MAG: hypothetical protein MRQ07_02065 [Candidatus Midichloria sp.]|nr:hypothetical protein [Candidatus Midichloria sp.]
MHCKYVEISSPLQANTTWNPQVYEAKHIIRPQALAGIPTLYAMQSSDLPQYEVVALNAQNLTLPWDLAQYETSFGE